MDLVSLLRSEFPDLPETHILNESDATEEYGCSTFSDPVRLNGAVRIVNRQQISQLLILANRYRISLYPISSGKNWGYGSVTEYGVEHKLLVDLSLLNRIQMVSAELGLVTLEPGVTQQQLSDYLKQHNLPYMTPVTGAGPSCSVLSNALETGYGITPYTDHFEAVTSIRGYFAHPELCDREFRSAVAELDKSGDDFIDKTYKWALGPYLDGLFAQSNLGIVTEMTIRLAKQPDAFSAFYIQCNAQTSLDSIVPFIRSTLQQFSGIIGSVNLMDKRRLLSMTAENPNGKSAHKVMTDEQIATLAKKNNTPEWMIVGTIYGHPNVVDAVKKVIKSQSSGFGPRFFSDSALMNFARALSNRFPVGPLAAIKKQLETLDKGIEVMCGTPNQVALPLAYWRNPLVENTDNRILIPDKDKCGLLWYAPLIPMQASKIGDFVELIRSTTPRFGIEPLITFTNLKHDCIDATVPIVFNHQDAYAREQAHACLETLVEKGLEYGYTPYRLNTQQQASLLDPDTVFWDAVARVKDALDPNGIISPGRYCPSR